MKLRMRLALTTVALAVPIALTLTWVHMAVESSAHASVLTEYVLAAMLSGERERCEEAPESWSLDSPMRMDSRGKHHHGPSPGDRPMRGPPPLEEGGRLGRGPPSGPGTRLFAYDTQLRSHNPAAPVLDEKLAAAMRQGKDTASLKDWLSEHGPLQLVMRMPWASGPCAFVLVQRAEPPPGPGKLRPFVPPPDIWLYPTLISLAGVLLTLGPVVRRLRQLTGEVRASAKSAYQGPITLQGHDEITELARAFHDAGREVREQMDLKEKREQTLRTFLENTTHDVMIPLTVLKGHLAELQERAAKGEPVEASVVAAASQEAHYMAALIHNLGVAARLEAGEPSVQRVQVDLNALVERCLGRHRPIARQQEVALEGAVPETPVEVVGDMTLIEQAVSNVIYNAVRYNARGGHVAVLLERQPGDTFRLRVFDDGPGIPEEELSTILERRVRGNAARTRGPGGQGLGLNIAWKVSVLHGWSLELGRSEYGGLQVDFLGALPPRAAPGGAAPEERTG